MIAEECLLGILLMELDVSSHSKEQHSAVYICVCLCTYRLTISGYREPHNRKKFTSTRCCFPRHPPCCLSFLLFLDHFWHIE